MIRKETLREEIYKIIEGHAPERACKLYAHMVAYNLPLQRLEGGWNTDPRSISLRAQSILKEIDLLRNDDIGYSPYGLLNSFDLSIERKLKMGLDGIESYFKEIVIMAEDARPRSAARSDVIEGFLIAEQIALNYWTYFKKVPVTGKTRRGSKERSLFDRICDCVELHLKKIRLKVLIGSTPRKQAVDWTKRVAGLENTGSATLPYLNSEKFLSINN